MIPDFHGTEKPFAVESNNDVLSMLSDDCARGLMKPKALNLRPRTLQVYQKLRPSGWIENSDPVYIVLTFHNFMALSSIVNIYTYKRVPLMARLMSTVEAIRNFRMLLYAKWNEICMKFCRCVLCDTCHTFGHGNTRWQWLHAYS